MNSIVQRFWSLNPEKRALLLKQLPAVSFSEQRMWFLQSFNPESAYYNMPAAIQIRGDLDKVALEKALNEIVRRHDTLHSNFVLLDGTLAKCISAAEPVSIPCVDLRPLPENELYARARKLAHEESHRPFDLEHDFPIRFTLIQLSDADHVLLLTMHHIVSDGWSIGVLMQEFAALYTAYHEGLQSPLPELSIQYADYARWQRDLLEQGKFQEEIQYWSERLKNIVSPFPLPTDRPRPAHQSFRGAHASAALDPVLSGELAALARRENVTIFMVLLAAWKVLLRRYSGHNDIVIGTPVAGRTNVETERLIGLFVNTLVVRTDLSGDCSFLETLRRVREASLAAFARQTVPFEKLVEVLQPERDAAYSPLFQMMFVLQNAAAAKPPELPGLELSAWDYEMGMSQFDLMLTAVERPEGFHLTMEYSTDLFDLATIQRMLMHYEVLLKAVVAYPECDVAALPMMDREEQHLLLHRWQGESRTFEPPLTLHELFTGAAQRTPESVAVICGDKRWNFAELHRRSNQLARYLRNLGTGQETRVAVCLDRDPQMIAVLLAILKAGGTYVPLDPSYPQERLTYILNDSQATVLITNSRFLGRLATPEIHTLLLDELDELLAQTSDADLECVATPQNLAYIIYTSGSTGKPKGVGVEHRSAATLVHWARNIFSQEDLQGVLASTSICFDLSVFEIFFPLAFGGTVILTSNALDLVSSNRSEQIRLINTVPSAMAELLRMKGVPASARTLSLAGEVLPPSLVNQIFATTQVERIFNLYGPSEDTTYSTYTCIDRENPGAAVTIGRPIANTVAYVLNEAMQLTPIGVPGQLCIGGAGLARGYLGRPELTAEKFVPNPFSTQGGERLYRTGDKVRLRRDGNLEFLGRFDQQIKLRGYRIEIGEVESALLSHIQVEQAAVTVREDTPGDKRLVAYVVNTYKERPIDASELRLYLQSKLPEYMVPAAYVSLTELPLTPNRKLDRNRLPKPEITAHEQAFVEPHSRQEQILARIWSEVLKLKRIGTKDNFFHAGGHSLLATQVVSRVRAELGFDLPLQQLFANPTIAQLASYIERSSGEKSVETIVRDLSAEAPEDLLSRLDELSDEEVNRLLDHVGA
jgi:amino acid adenylation domain-containing protein